MMSDQGVFGRRRFLGGVLVSALAVVPGVGMWIRSSGRASEGTEEALRLVGLLNASPDVAALGRSYLRTRDDQPSVATLLGELLPPGRGPAWLAAATDRQIREELSLSIRDDFAGDRIDVVDSWMLSATEARVAGVAAIVAR